MALTSSIDHPSNTANTPTPYRVPTSAVRIWEPRKPTTAEYTLIREQIEPRKGFWQFQIRPWHIAVFFGSYVTVVGSFIAVVAAHGGLR